MRRSIDGVLNARCEVIESRMDARVAALRGEIQALMVRMDERDSRNEATFKSIKHESV